MYGTNLCGFVHITAFPDIDISADALYNQNKEVMLLCQLNTFLSVLNAIIKLTFLLALFFSGQRAKTGTLSYPSTEINLPFKNKGSQMGL